jgi:hypothetical protein
MFKFYLSWRITKTSPIFLFLQERFLLTQASPPNEDSSLWDIPLTYEVQDGNFDDTSTKQWLTESSLKIARPTDENEWFIFNVQQAGK